MPYQQVFGGTTIYPSDVSYLAITLSADKALEWPLESNDPANPASRIIDVTATGSHSIVLPDATLTGAGQTILFNNLPASAHSFTVKDYAGGTIATVGVGEQWQVYLADTATAAGTWRVFRYGASTATVQPSALAGYGITVTSSTLSQSTPVTTFNSTPRSVLLTDRASMLVWVGTGAGVLNLPSTVTAGNNFLVSARNNGGGDLTVTPAGSETIDGGPALVLQPGDSASLTTDGLTWYTLGLGQEAVFAFDYTSIAVTGGTYTLAGSELNRIAYQFVGALTSDQYIVVPATIQQYWVDNATTGAYALYLQTSGGTPVAVSQGSRGIYYCNGANVVDADTGGISVPVLPSDGGTGITSYTTGDILYASGPTVLSKLSDVAVGNALISGGVNVSPTWGKIGLTTHVSGTLPVANGGTGATTLTGYVKGSGTSAFTASATVPASDLSGTVAVANGGTGQSSFTDGQLLIGNSTGNTLTKATLTAGTGISITNGSGSVTVGAQADQVDIFTSSGTYTKPSWASVVEVIAIGGGGGGGSGRKGAASTGRSGGGGGGGGGFSRTSFRASDLSATVSVTVGTGGAGGAAQTTNSTNGNAGAAGGTTNFGTYVYATGGRGGGGGTATATGSAAGGRGTAGTAGTGGTAGTSAGTVGSLGVGGSGGGGGGAVDSSNTSVGGGQGFNTANSTAPSYINGNTNNPTGASVTGAANSGTDLTSSYWFGGESGDGGGSSTSGNAYAGGNGGKWGGGGGGGGAAVDSVGNSGAGGNGGNGICVVISRV